MVNVGPVRTDIDDSLNAQWLAIRPGTDTALLIAIAKTLVDEQLIDNCFIQQNTVGMDKFQNYLNGLDDGYRKGCRLGVGDCAVPANRIRNSPAHGREPNHDLD